MNILEISKMIDHSLLHPTYTDEQIAEECGIAAAYNTAAVCVKPYSVPLAYSLLSDTEVKVCSVSGFPHGNSHIRIKVDETVAACSEGAEEIDMVVNIGKVLSNCWDYIHSEIEAVNSAAIDNGAILKVIFENDFLDRNSIANLCEICNRTGVAFIKTSTGYGFKKQENGFYKYDGATMEHLKLMREKSDADIRIKAAGGIRTLRDLLTVKALGVSRAGATSTRAVMEEARKLNTEGKLDSFYEECINRS